MKSLKISIVILFIGIFMSGSFVADAQRGEFGLRFMPTFTSFGLKSSTGGTLKGEVTFGYGVGAILGFQLTDHVGIQGEMIYSSISQTYTESDIEHDIRLKYVNIPLLISLNTGKTNHVNFNAVFGPQIGIRVGSKLLSSGNGSGGSEPVLSVKKGDFGLAYGAGLDFGLSASQKWRLGIGFRGVLGLLDISDNSGTVVTNSYYILDRTHLKTYSGYIGVSYLF